MDTRIEVDRKMQIVDTHTGGEPTRVVISGGPELGHGSMIDRRHIFSTQFDDIRRAICCEPRGSDVLVGAILLEPVDEKSVAGTVFFNNVGFLGMCGHGTMGLAVAMAHIGKISFGTYQLETPVGTVRFELGERGRVTVENVASYRFQKEVAVRLSDGSLVHGDLAWGGNWFFICEDHGLSVDTNHIAHLTRLANDIRRHLDRNSICGDDGSPIDHVELLGPPSKGSGGNSRNFVLCPGGAYDRSPCGTGTSAKIACLAADGKLEEGQIWRQESIIGSIFEATFRTTFDGTCIPRLTGSAFITGRTELIFDPDDPFRMGIQH